MNWNAISALTGVGLLILALIPFFKPNLNNVYSRILIFLFLVLLGLILYHKFSRLIRKGKNGGAVYKVKWGIKHWIENPETLKKLGYTWDDVESTSDFLFHLYPTGKSINLKQKS